MSRAGQSAQPTRAPSASERVPTSVAERGVRASPPVPFGRPKQCVVHGGSLVALAMPPWTFDARHAGTGSRLPRNAHEDVCISNGTHFCLVPPSLPLEPSIAYHERHRLSHPQTCCTNNVGCRCACNIDPAERASITQSSACPYERLDRCTNEQRRKRHPWPLSSDEGVARSAAAGVAEGRCVG